VADRRRPSSHRPSPGEFGSGVVIPDTGIVWQNRGAAFSLDPQHLLALALSPGPLPPPQGEALASSMLSASGCRASGVSNA
jgi:gamma-glutamyltranspeptidase